MQLQENIILAPVWKLSTHTDSHVTHPDAHHGSGQFALERVCVFVQDESPTCDRTDSVALRWFVGKFAGLEPGFRHAFPLTDHLRKPMMRAAFGLRNL